MWDLDNFFLFWIRAMIIVVAMMHKGNDQQRKRMWLFLCHFFYLGLCFVFVFLATVSLLDSCAPNFLHHVPYFPPIRPPFACILIIL